VLAMSTHDMALIALVIAIICAVAIFLPRIWR
jgi:hypothetical protein